MACEGSSYTRTAKRSLGEDDLIAAAEWRELTSRYSASRAKRAHPRSIYSSTPNPARTRRNKGVCVRRHGFAWRLTKLPTTATGKRARFFTRLETTVSENFEKRGELGAAVSGLAER